MDNTSVFYEFVWNQDPTNHQLADGKWTPGEVRRGPMYPSSYTDDRPWHSGFNHCKGNSWA